MIKGYDFDGTLCTTNHEGWFGKLMWKFFPRFYSFLTHSFVSRTKLEFESGSFVITGRPGDGEKNLTQKQMDKWGIDGILVIDTTKSKPNRESSIEWKVKKINELGIEEFYEDDDQTIWVLNKLTKAKIIKV